MEKQAIFWPILLVTWFAASFACEDRDFTDTSPAVSTTPPIIASTGMAAWEYKVLVVDAPNHELTGPNAGATNEVPIDAAELTTLGALGWELTTSWLEPETAFPGHPNVRPMRAVLLFKRPAAKK